jgi:uncharacterized membrane protein
MAAQNATAILAGTAQAAGGAGRPAAARGTRATLAGEPELAKMLAAGPDVRLSKRTTRIGETGSSPQAARPASSMSDVIAWLLVGGVATSAAVLIIGLVLLAITGQTGYGEPLSARLLLTPEGTVTLPRTIGDVLRGALQLRPFAMIELGALLLIATPIFRVAASVLLFLAERDRLYAAITLVVLALLLASVFWLGLAA